MEIEKMEKLKNETEEQKKSRKGYQDINNMIEFDNVNIPTTLYQAYQEMSDIAQEFVNQYCWWYGNDKDNEEIIIQDFIDFISDDADATSDYTLTQWIQDGDGYYYIRRMYDDVIDFNMPSTFIELAKRARLEWLDDESHYDVDTIISIVHDVQELINQGCYEQ